MRVPLPFRPQVILLAALLAWPEAARAARAPAPTLEARADELSERHQKALRSPGSNLEALLADLRALARDAEKARVDTVAYSAHMRESSVLGRLARRPEAERAALQAAAAALRARSPRRLAHARLVAADLRATADPQGALEMVESALPEIRALGDDALLAEAYDNVSHACFELGRFERALPACRANAAHRAAAKDDHGLSLAWSSCSQALRFLGRHAEARAVTDSALRLARETGDRGLPLSRALSEKASLHRTAREFPEALAAIREAIEVDRARGDRSHERISRMFRARLYQTMGRNVECAADLDTMLASPEVQRSFSQLTRVSAMWARSMAAIGRAPEADSVLARVIDRYERFRNGLGEEEDRAGAHEHASEVYTARTRVLLTLKRPEAAWASCERGRGAQLEWRLGATDAPPLAKLQARLGAARAALIEYDVPDPTVGNVFLVTADGVRGFPLGGFVEKKDIDAVLEALGDDQPAAWPDSAAAHLGRDLLGLVGPLLPAGIERVYVVPPSRIESVPFEALTVPGRGAALGDLFAVSYVPSAGVLLALDARAAAPADARRITVLADPVVNAKHPSLASLDPQLRGEALRPLPGALAEARAIGGRDARVHVGRDATLDRLLAARKSALLHLATHALALPGGDALVLAGREPMLTAARVESLGLSADLVTLSACGTLGRTRRTGEGTFGLVRAFHAAGSRTVLGTRWSVNDRAAARFMTEFYAALRSGAARDVALVRARRKLRAEGVPPRDCWAFLLSGVGDRPLGVLTDSRGTSGALSK